MLAFLTVVLAAIIFEYSNGFHDAANAIATVVSTKVLTPRQAIAMAAVFNLTGALFGGAVASTIGKGLVDTNVVTMTTVLCALIAAFAWNIITWWVGIPSSSSHALIGGLCGAAIASAHGQWSVLKWNTGLWPKVVLPMFTSPIAGFILGAIIMFLLFVTLHKFRPRTVHSLFGRLQIFSAAWMAHSHGTNDAQKTMGIITLALFTGTKAGSFEHLPVWLQFLHTPGFWQRADMGESPLCGNDGSGNGRRWLANYSHTRSSHGEAAAGAWFCGGDDRRAHHSRRQSLRHSAFDHPCHFHFDHGSRRDETFQRREVDGGRTHCVGMDLHAARDRTRRLFAYANFCPDVNPRHVR